jgi:hypothetical protein
MNALPIRNKLDLPGEAFYLCAGAAGLDERSFGSNSSRTKLEIIDCLASLLGISLSSASALAINFGRAARALGKDAAREYLNQRLEDLA